MGYNIIIYGEFDYIIRAFQFVALMFSPSTGYIGLVAILGILAIFFTGLFAISSSTFGKGTMQSWFMYLVGTGVIVALITGPKSPVNIHDMTTNQFRTVGGVPTVMAVIAHLENRIENIVTDTIELVMQPIVPYDVIGKGKGFDLLASMENYGKEFFNKRPYTQRSIENYWERCVVPDLSLGFLDEDAIYKSDNIWVSIKSQTRSRNSIVYSDAKQMGESYTCADAWSKIDNQLLTPELLSSAQTQCKTQHGDDVAAIQRCMESFQSIIETIVAPTSDLNSYFQSYLVAWSMMSSTGFLKQSLADVNKKYMSSAAMAEKQVPRLKGVLYGMIIGIFPLLIGFIWFNPMKTITFYLGMFLLMILWSAIDTFMDMQYQNEVMNLFSTMRAQKLGLHQMFDISSTAADAVALYGSGRWMALGFATAIMTAITGISSYAISQMGSQLASTAQGAASEAASRMSSAGQSQQKQQAAGDLANRELANQFTVANWNAMANQPIQSSYEQISKTGALKNTYGNNADAGVMLGSTGGAQSIMGIGSTLANKEAAGALGMDLQSLGNLQARGNVLSKGDAAGLNSKFDTDIFQEGKKLSYGIADGKLENMELSWKGALGEQLTQSLNDDGKVGLMSIEGGNFHGYSKDANGNEFGSYSYMHNNVGHTQTYNGSRMTDTYTENGVAMSKEFAKKDGQWLEVARSVGNKVDITEAAMQEMVSTGDFGLVADRFYNTENGELSATGKSITRQSAALLESIVSKSFSSNDSADISIGGGKFFIGANAYMKADKDERINLIHAQLMNLAIANGKDQDMSSYDAVQSYGDTISRMYQDGLSSANQTPIENIGNRVKEKASDIVNSPEVEEGLKKLSDKYYGI